MHTSRLPQHELEYITIFAVPTVLVIATVDTTAARSSMGEEASLRQEVIALPETFTIRVGTTATRSCC